MSLPMWLDPTGALSQFQEGMRGHPVREQSQAEEFRVARLESDEMQRIDRETKAALVIVNREARREAARRRVLEKRSVKRDAILLECVERGETPKERNLRKAREIYAANKTKKQASARERYRKRMALHSKTL
jgi:hypothetical protein